MELSCSFWRLLKENRGRDRYLKTRPRNAARTRARLSGSSRAAGGSIGVARLCTREGSIDGERRRNDGRQKKRNGVHRAKKIAGGTMTRSRESRAGRIKSSPNIGQPDRHGRELINCGSRDRVQAVGAASESERVEGSGGGGGREKKKTTTRTTRTRTRTRMPVNAEVSQ